MDSDIRGSDKSSPAPDGAGLESVGAAPSPEVVPTPAASPHWSAAEQLPPALARRGASTAARWARPPVIGALTVALVAIVAAGITIWGAGRPGADAQSVELATSHLPMAPPLSDSPPTSRSTGSTAAGGLAGGEARSLAGSEAGGWAGSGKPTVAAAPLSAPIATTIRSPVASSSPNAPVLPPTASSSKQSQTSQSATTRRTAESTTEPSTALSAPSSAAASTSRRTGSSSRAPAEPPAAGAASLTTPRFSVASVGAIPGEPLSLTFSVANSATLPSGKRIASLTLPAGITLSDVAIAIGPPRRGLRSAAGPPALLAPRPSAPESAAVSCIGTTCTYTVPARRTVSITLVLAVGTKAQSGPLVLRTAGRPAARVSITVRPAAPSHTAGLLPPAPTSRMPYSPTL